VNEAEVGDTTEEKDRGVGLIIVDNSSVILVIEVVIVTVSFCLTISVIRGKWPKTGPL